MPFLFSVNYLLVNSAQNSCFPQSLFSNVLQVLNIPLLPTLSFLALFPPYQFVLVCLSLSYTFLLLLLSHFSRVRLCATP